MAFWLNYSRQAGIQKQMEELAWSMARSFSGENETSAATQEIPSRTAWNPVVFSDPHDLSKVVDRGINVINVLSGAYIATWSYAGKAEKPLYKRYKQWFPREKFLHERSEAAMIQEWDTVFVFIIQLEEFVNEFLGSIKNRFVLITKPTGGVLEESLRVKMLNLSQQLVDHPMVVHWFTHDIGRYTGDQESHPKVSPFPLGLKPKRRNVAFKNTFLSPINTFRKVFRETIENPVKEKELIFYGFIRDTNNNRSQIPRGPDLPYIDYLRRIARAHYVISPDGDHPDCNRHYESLGLGAIPITQLDARRYRHLQGAPVIFDNQDWDNQTLSKRLLASNSSVPNRVVNRNFAFEEFWMEYVERIVGRPLRWFDVLQGKAAFMADFQMKTNHS